MVLRYAVTLQVCTHLYMPSHLQEILEATSEVWFWPNLSMVRIKRDDGWVTDVTLCTGEQEAWGPVTLCSPDSIVQSIVLHTKRWYPYHITVYWLPVTSPFSNKKFQYRSVTRKLAALCIRDWKARLTLIGSARALWQYLSRCYKFSPASCSCF
jgi:hypothetical protein